MKKRYVYGSIVATILGLASYQLAQDKSKEEKSIPASYVDKKENKPSQLAAGEKTPQQISEEEDNNAEQIVVKITDQGYVTLHGDHYHFFNGKVPYDAIISGDLILRDTNYVFNQADVVSEVKDGYILKVNGQYYLYLRDGSQQVNIRNINTGIASSQATAGERPGARRGQGGGSQGAANSPSQSQLWSQARAAGRYTTDDGYIFEPTDVIDDFGDAFLVKHGTHFHYIPKDHLSPSERTAAQAYWNQKRGNTPPVTPPQARPNPVAPKQTPKPIGKGNPQTPSPIQSPPSHKKPITPSTPISNPVPSPVAPSEDWRVWLRQLYSLPLSQRYQEGDGLVFDPAKILRRLPMGVVIAHGDHYHVIPYDKMSDLERKIAQVIPLLGEAGNPNTPTSPVVVAPVVPALPSTPVVPTPAPVVPAPPVAPTPTPVSPTPPVSPVTPPTSPSVPVPPVAPPSTPVAPTPTPVVPTPPANPVTPPKTPSEPTSPGPKGVAGIDYPTSDGFLFDGTGIQGWTSAGLLVNHDGHIHLLLTGDIAQSKWAYLLPTNGENPTPSVELPAHLVAQRAALANSLGLPIEKILVVTVDQKVVGFHYPHDDHYDFVAAIEEVVDPTELTKEQKRELTAYIRKAYGLLLGTPVTFKDSLAVFAIPHPHQDYDPNRDYYSDEIDPAFDAGHVHPYFVPLNKLRIPEQTGNAELDFENELLIAAERLSIPVGQVQIKDDKYFVLPGKDHDHYLNIFSIEGLKAYRENSLALIQPHIATGEFSKESVLAEIQRIEDQAKTLMGEDTLEYRRVRRALEQYREELEKGGRSSTQAYLEALQAFENRYLLKQEVDQPVETNPLEEKTTQLMDRINRMGEKRLSQYGTRVEELVDRLKTAVVSEDSLAIDRVEAYLKAIERVEDAPNSHLPRVAYMDFFLRHVDSPYLSIELRESLSEKLAELHSFDNNLTAFKPSLESLVVLKSQVKEALAAAQTQVVQLGDAYTKLNNSKVNMVGRVNHWASIFRYAITEEEKEEGFDGKLQVLPAIKETVSEAPVETNPSTPQPGTPSEPADGGTAPEAPQPPADPYNRWLTELPEKVRQAYRVDQWASDMAAAVNSGDTVSLERYSRYIAAIERIEKQNRSHYAAARTAYLDYIIRHIDKAYIPSELREEMARKALFLQFVESQPFKQSLTAFVDLKERIRGAIAQGQVYEVSQTSGYQVFLESRSDMVEDLQLRSDYLLQIGYITAEEQAEGFGQPIE